MESRAYLLILQEIKIDYNEIEDAYNLAVESNIFNNFEGLL